jgi:acyl carrier protein
MPSDQSIAAAVKQFILDEFLPGEDPAELTDETPLITAGILDSVGTLRLVAFLEERFGIGLAAHEADVEYLNTISAIVRLVESKQKGR